MQHSTTDEISPVNGNPICQRQDLEEWLRFLVVQRQLYSRAKCWVWLNLLLLTAPPLGIGLAGYYLKIIEPFAAVYAGLAVIVEVFFTSHLVDRWRKAAALVQEAFDCGVLRLDWNQALCGNYAEATRYVPSQSPSDEPVGQDLKGWYATDVSSVPLLFGQLLCQLTNVAYSKRQQETYSIVLVAFCAASVVLPVIVGLIFFGSITLAQWLILVFAPSIPLFGWFLRECLDHGKISRDLQNIDVEIRSTIEAANTSLDTLPIKIRRIQDIIFLSRSGNPTIFDFFYKWRRGDLEAQTKNEIARLAREILDRSRSPAETKPKS